MLVLSRKKNQTVIVDGKYEVIVLEVVGRKVRLGFVAPHDIAIHRGEVQDKIDGKQAGTAT